MIQVGEHSHGTTDPSGTKSVAITICGALDASAARWGERIAIVDGKRRCSYRELRGLAMQVASGLLELGVAQGDRVALWMPNCLEWAVGFFGAAYAGAVVVPLNTALSVTEVGYQVAHSGASVLVVSPSYRNRDYLSEARRVKDLIGRDIAVIASTDEGLDADVIPWAQIVGAGVEAGVDTSRFPSVEVTDPAMMLYTSGTTGRPKGAVHTHGFVGAQLSVAARLGLSESDCAVLYLPLFHIYALVAGLILMTVVGARTVLMARFEAGDSLRLIEDEGATVIHGIPTTYIDQLNDPAIDHTNFSSVRFAFTPLAYDLCQKVRSRFGVKCLNPYGMTETAACVLVAALDDDPELAVRTVGRAVAGMEAKIVDEATGLPVPNGTPGGLMLRGPSILWKYHDSPDTTADAFDAEGWFRTGDVASLDEAGNVTFIGRLGDSYRVGGEIVDPVEVEAAVQSHPDVLRAAALAVPDERLGEVGYAWAVLRSGSDLTQEDLRAHAARRLAPFKVPVQIRFIDQFPTTPSGKVQKFRLRESLKDEAPATPS